MLSTNLVLASILAASLASADVPLSAQHDATYSLAKSGTRNLRTMMKPTAQDATNWAPPAHQAEHYATSTPTYHMKPNAGSPSEALWCDNIGGDSGAQAGNGLNLDVILSIGADSARACCNACVNTNLCVAFNFQPLLVTDLCLLARLRDGIVEGQPDSLIDLNVAALANL